MGLIALSPRRSLPDTPFSFLKQAFGCTLARRRGGDGAASGLGGGQTGRGGPQFLSTEADTVAYGGRLRDAREITRQAVASAEHADEKESAAYYEADAALRESLFGNAAQARQRAVAALRRSAGRDVQLSLIHI